ncbi:MAG TPA: asparaginase [Candidatus Limnocylindrales bacterium]|nr:asparaginase [Candidatus Limnocylindrales bacterium]
MARVAVVFTGGTISMRFDAAAGGAVPSLDGAAILARTPGLDGIADVEPVDWGLVPASHLAFGQLLDLAGTVRAALAQPDVDGAVVVQGTDTIDESAFALDLLCDGGKPVVVTGAMRNAGEDGYDGPANLRDAVRAAAHPDLRGQGGLVVLAGAILPADDAQKMHTTAYTTFQAPNTGPLGVVQAGEVRVHHRRARRRVLPGLPATVPEPIVLLTAVTGMDGTLARLAIGQAGARGLVVAATGAGNTHPDLLAAAVEAMTGGVPVVLVSRATAGGVQPSYAFPGGGAQWLRAGAMLAGTLTGPKARIALGLALGAGLEGDALAALVAG